MSEKEKLLKIQDLSVEYDTEISTVYAVNGLDMELGYGETLGLVGETGAGKTSTALSIIQLLPEGIGFVTSGSIQLDGVDPDALTAALKRCLSDGGWGAAAAQKTAARLEEHFTWEAVTRELLRLAGAQQPDCKGN